MAVNRPQQVDVRFAGGTVAVESDDAIEALVETRLALRGRLALQGTMLVGLVLAVYAIALRGSFIFLDDKLVLENALLRTWRGVWPIWVHPTILTHYRPLATSALLVQFKLFGVKYPAGYLLVNLLLHATNVILLWTILRRLALPSLMALAAAAVFAVHPMNVEAVAWIAQQPLLLSSTFFLMAILVHLRYCGIEPIPPDEGKIFQLPVKPWRLGVLAAGLAFAAAACHPMAVVLPMALLVILWWKRDGRVERIDLVQIIPLAAIALAWFAVTRYGDDRRSAGDVGSASLLTWTDHLLISGRAYLTYALHLLLPVQLGFAYPKWPLQRIWLQVFFLMILIVVFLVAWFLRSRFGGGFFAISALFITLLLPVCIFRQDLEPFTYVSDHVAYLAGIPLMLGIVWSFDRLLAKAPNWSPSGLAVIASVLGAAAIARAPDYRTSQDLWSAALRADPNSVAAHGQLGLIELEENHNFVAAMEHFNTALERAPDDPTIQIDIAKAYESKGDTKKALMRYQQAVERAPNNPEAHLGLAAALAEQRDTTKAVQEYEKVIQLRPDNINAHNNLGLLHTERGEYDRAIESYHKAISINPGFTPAYLNLASLLFAQRKISDAEKTLSDVLAIDPTNFFVRMYAGDMLQQLAQNPSIEPSDREVLLGRSERFFRTAVSLQPRSSDAHAHLAITLYLLGRRDEAIYEVKRATDLDPANREYAAQLDLWQKGQTAVPAQ